MTNPRFYISLIVLLAVSLSCQFLSSTAKQVEESVISETPAISTSVEEEPSPTVKSEGIEEATSIPSPEEEPTQEEAPATEEVQVVVVNEEATTAAEDAGTLTAKGYLERADDYLNKKAYQEAIDDYTYAIALDKKSQSAFWHRGIAQYSLGEYDKALEDLDAAIKLWPGQPNPYYWRGLVYHAMGEYEKAIAEYDLAIEKTKVARWTKSDWGYIYTARQEAEDALNK